MKRYDSYKDSGVEWIGEIPNNWKVGFMKYQLSNNDGGVWGTDVENEDEGTIVIRSTEITIDGNWDLSNPMRRKLSDVEINKTLLKEGDIVLTKSSGSPDHIGKSVIVNEEISNLLCCYSNFVQRLRFRNYSPKLYHYILNSYIVREQYRYLTQSTTGLGNLNGTTINEVIIPFIPLPEQQQIVSFLDSKTSQIDELIQKKERKIELLKEYRTSLINQVVTKGLNPNVEMKDSGIEWIGEIPRGWDLRKGSTIGTYSKGNGIKKDEVREVGLPCIRYGEIYTKYNHKFDRVQTYIEEGVTDIKVSSGTLFMTGSGELLEDIGKCVVYVGVEDLYVGGDIIILKPCEDYHSEFLSYQINSESVRIQRELNGRGGIIVHIYSKNFKDMWFPTPPLSEQQQIVSYLDEQSQKIDSSIQSEEKKIELLKEYRQSLISEVVTGKIDVRVN